jgi:hypothetical protein
VVDHKSGTKSQNAAMGKKHRTPGSSYPSVVEVEDTYYNRNDEQTKQLTLESSEAASKQKLEPHLLGNKYNPWQML